MIFAKKYFHYGIIDVEVVGLYLELICAQPCSYKDENQVYLGSCLLEGRDHYDLC